jgi:uncharacterized protein (TIGR02996 family)
MNRADAFLEAITAEPDEAAHRLVYADWLEEHGGAADQARAEFIRAQCALASLPRHDPSRRGLRAREQALLREHEAEWAAPVSDLVSRWRFRRGFIEEVTITASQLLRRGADLFRLAPVGHVRLRGTLELPALLQGPARQQKFAALLDRLRGLDLGMEYLRDEIGLAFQSLPHLPRLQHLNIGNNQLTVTALRTLASSDLLESLQSLECGRAGAGFGGLRVLLESPHLKQLCDLGLTGTLLDEADAAALAALPLVGRLTALRLGHGTPPRGSSLGTPHASGLRTLVQAPALANLVVLDLSFNQLEPAVLRPLAAAPQLDRLEELNLSRIGLGLTGVKALARGPLLGHLAVLDLSLNRLEDAAAEALASCKHECRLAVLDLIYNHFSPAGVQTLRDRFGDGVCLFQRD